jgi:exodeoxyribonuclease V alpha subunit
MITRNDYNLRLFNGDIGITGLDQQDGAALRVFFQGTNGELRQFLPQMLPEHETAYAMTVHKSQGSEFDKVLLILPDRQVEVLTRELIYTAITRAKKEVMLWGLEPVFEKAVASRIERNSGLNDALWV